MAKYPTLQDILDKFGDNLTKDTEILRTRRSLRSLLKLTTFFLAVLIATIYLIYMYPNFNLIGAITTKSYVSIRWLGIFPAILFLELLRRRHNDLYVFTLHTLSRHAGRLSLNFYLSNIRYIDIRAVIVHQNIWARIFGYGSVELDTAAQEKTELYLEGVKDPESLGNLIEELRKYSLNLAKPEDLSSKEGSVLGE
jgi:Bacterial PH domain